MSAPLFSKQVIEEELPFLRLSECTSPWCDYCKTPHKTCFAWIGGYEYPENEMDICLSCLSKALHAGGPRNFEHHLPEKHMDLPF